jgi:hypothetical protein
MYGVSWYHHQGHWDIDIDPWLACCSACSQVLPFPGVDHTRTTSNHLIEIISVLGIEAVRNALLKEVGGWLGEQVELTHPGGGIAKLASGANPAFLQQPGCMLYFFQMQQKYMCTRACAAGP